ncbi:unnamed protein product [Phytomonas sp. EM1]|nr:unnamed protein product [Phytomonas sp. EM1]|eukprot:CCW60996.1 unnamed protein product [Phytomonas sp. isolate EM1]
MRGAILRICIKNDRGQEGYHPFYRLMMHRIPRSSLKGKNHSFFFSIFEHRNKYAVGGFYTALW